MEKGFWWCIFYVAKIHVVAVPVHSSALLSLSLMRPNAFVVCWAI